MRFRILRGIHTQREVDPSNAKCPECDGTKKVTLPWKRGEHDCTHCIGTGLKHYVATYDAKDPDKCVLESETNLEARFGSEKFQNIDRLSEGSVDVAVLRKQVAELEAKLQAQGGAQGGGGTAVADPELAAMTVNELKKYAQEFEIDISDASNKQEIVNVIQSAIDSA